MASTFKNLLNDDVTTTRTLLHEAIPITGTIVTGTYKDENIKTFTHGMFESVYDYPYLSSSANHIFDLTYGCSSAASSSVAYNAADLDNGFNTQQAKKLNIYNQMAQVLMGYTTASLIKKGSFRLTMFPSGSVTNLGGDTAVTIGDYQAANEFRTSPAGDYGLIYTSSSDINANSSYGMLFYQAGVMVLTSSLFVQEFGGPQPDLIKLSASAKPAGFGVDQAQTGSTIEQLARGFRHRVKELTFNNSIELNSTIYFCRANHNEFNYSSNPTYVTGSKLRVKKNVGDLPLSYITSIGLYSSDNELLAVAKLSEPIKKDPNTELTLRVRLDY